MKKAQRGNPTELQINVASAAVMLGVPDSTIQKLINEGTFTAVRRESEGAPVQLSWPELIGYLRAQPAAPRNPQTS